MTRLPALRAAFLMVLVWLGHVGWARAAADPKTFDYHLHARALATGVYVVEGANADFSVANGCNIINTGFILGRDGVLVINTGPSKRYGDQLRALIARTTKLPVKMVVNLNLHPDYYFGNQAFADVPRLATTTTRKSMSEVVKAYEDNMYRLCGDWMKDTQALLPDTTLVPGPLALAGRDIEVRELKGHTASDAVLIDRASGVAFVGGLVFVHRIPTTPDARLPDWFASLDALQAMHLPTMVPSHGPIAPGASGIEQTRGYLRWLDTSFRAAAEAGLDDNDVLEQTVPAEYRSWAAFSTEYIRNVAHLYHLYERRALTRHDPGPEAKAARASSTQDGVR